MDLTAGTSAFFEALCRTARAVTGCRDAQVCFDDVLPTEVLVVVDAVRSGHPIGAAFAGARFVAGVPIPGGALWLTDPQARDDSAGLRAQLADLGVLASTYLAQQTDATLYRTVLENSADTLIRGTLDGIRRYVSPSIKTLLGYHPDELVGKRASDITHPEDVAEFAVKMRAMGEGRVDTFTTEHRMLHRNGEWVWLEAFVRVTYHPVTGARDGYVVSVRDTSRRKELESRLEHNATHDVLTGLPNRALLYERLQQQLDGTAEFAVLCVDLDGFKKVNDELGHSVGDAVLSAVAARLVSCVPATDTVARRSGDEFVVIHTEPETAAVLARRLVDTASVPMTIGAWTGTVGLSIGIAVGGPHAGAEELLRAADSAMYEAKAAGRNGYRIAGPPA